MERTLIEQLEEIRLTKLRDVGALGDRLARLDEELSAADRHIRDQISQMLDRSEARQSDIVGMLSDLLVSLRGRSGVPPIEGRFTAPPSAAQIGVADELFSSLYQYNAQPH